jgi:hypothetical protein
MSYQGEVQHNTQQLVSEPPPSPSTATSTTHPHNHPPAPEIYRGAAPDWWEEVRLAHLRSGMVGLALRAYT